MNVLNKLTLTDLKKNKKRTIVTIIGIALSTALICAVAGMIISFQQTAINHAIKNNGAYHVKFLDIPSEQVKYITKNNTLEESFLTASLGYAWLNNSQNSDKPYLHVVAMDDIALKSSALKLTSGRLPQNNNEIVIEDSIGANALVNYKVGDILELNIGNRINNGISLNQNDELTDGEQILNAISRSYTIVGTIERVSDVIEPHSAPGYTVITYESTGEILQKSTIDVAVTYKNPRSFEDNTSNIISVLKENTGNTYEYTTNKSLLEYEGNLDNETMTVLYRLGAIIIGIIVVTSIFTTRNAFAISVAEKTKEYGMLSSIGATSKQIKRSVLMEALIITTIALPLGILIGYLATYILVLVVNYYLAGSISESSELIFGLFSNMSWKVILLDIVLTYITVILSALIPAYRASKIAPVDAIRNSSNIKIKKNSLKTLPIIKKIFGIGGVIADKNLKRNKKKYRTTIISLVLSITVFIILYSFMQYGTKTAENYYVDLDYNIVVNNVDTDYKELLNVDEYESYSYMRYSDTKIDNSYVNTWAQEENTSLNILIFNQEYFKEYVKSLGLDENKADTYVILYNQGKHHDEDGAVVVSDILNVKEGSVITSKNNMNFNISKITDKKASGSQTLVSYTTATIYISDAYLKNTNQEDLLESISSGILTIQAKDSTSYETNLNKLINNNSKYSNVYYSNIDSFAKQEANMITLISIFLYGFIIVITLIGVTNVFNTITTSMMLRSKEFAMLKSIGMTKNEFNHMIRLESIMYGFKSLIIGIPLGLIGSYLIYKSIATKITFGWIIPWGGILISILFVVIIVGLIMRYSLNKVNKQNIIDTIRQDNI